MRTRIVSNVIPVTPLPDLHVSKFVNFCVHSLLPVKDWRAGEATNRYWICDRLWYSSGCRSAGDPLSVCTELITRWHAKIAWRWYIHQDRILSKISGVQTERFLECGWITIC